jgi:hypothetical protein
MSNLFTFDPQSSDAPLARGRHEVEIIAAQARTSRAGNPMLDITYRAPGPGGEVMLKDYLVSTPRSKWKIKRFCQALGLDFNDGQIDPALIAGRRLSVEVGVEDDGQGRDRNVVSDYVAAFNIGEATNGHGAVNRWKAALGKGEASGARSAATQDDGEGEDIPF